MFANEISEDKLASASGGAAGIEDSEREAPRVSLMDRHGIRTQSLEDQASCLSDWFLAYLNPLLKHGRPTSSTPMTLAFRPSKTGPVRPLSWRTTCGRSRWNALA